MQLFPFGLSSRFRPVLTVVEVFAVFAAGSVLGFLLAQMFGVALRNPLLALVEQPDLPLAPLALELAGVLFWQYLGWGFCGGLLYWLRPRGENLPATQQTLPVGWQQRFAFIAIVTALVAIPSLALTQAQELWQFGDRAPWFNALQQRERDAQFWLFTAVGSFAVIPVVEEIFYRGYLFHRLASAWQPGAAVALTASLFACSHVQYLQADAFNLAMLINVGYIGAVLALATWYSRSLLPAIVAHAVLNMPMVLPVAAVVIVASLCCLLLGWSRWQAFRQFVAGQWRATSGSSLLIGAALGIGFALLFHRGSMSLALAAIPVWLGLVSYRIWQRWRSRATAGDRLASAG